MVNGFSGYIPPLYRELQSRWEEQPLASNLADARALGVRFVIVHGEGWKPGVREPVIAGLAALPDEVRLAAQCGPDAVYEIIHPTAVVEPDRPAADRLPPSAAWRAQASLHDELADQAIDGDLETRWTSGSGAGGATFSLDLGELRRVSGLRLRLGGNRRDHPRAYRVEASRDALSWSVIAEDRHALLPITAFLTPTDLALDVVLPTTECRHLRLTDLDEDPAARWAINEIEVLAAPAGPGEPGPER
jgi:hypothetical protein